MEKVTLKIGCKIGEEHFQVERTVEIPATWAEVEALPIPDTVKTACFNRAWRIRLQENSGAREFLTSLSADERRSENLPEVLKEVDGIIAEYIKDPTVAKTRGRPAKVQEVVLPATLSKKEAEKFAAVLAAQGIKATVASN